MSEGSLRFSSDLKDAGDSDVVFVAVGTPFMPNGQVDLSLVYEAVTGIIDKLSRPWRITI